MRQILFAAWLVLVTASSALAGAWTLAQDEWNVIQTASLYRTDHFYNNDGDRIRQPTYRKAEYNPYVEFGLNDDLTVGGSAFLAVVDGVDPFSGEESYNGGLVDPSFFARHRLWHDDATVFSIQPLIKLPSQYARDQLPRSGTEQLDAELRFLLGHSFKWMNRYHFLDAETGYRRRFDDPGDQLFLDLTAGFQVADRWMILPQLFTTWRAEDGRENRFTQSGEDDYHLIKGQLSGVYQLTPKTSLQAGIFSHLYSRNTGDGGGFLFSLWQRY